MAEHRPGKIRRSSVTMRDVAGAAGVHVTTVSLALRNSPQLPAATRDRIRSLADKMGYRVNPLLSALVQQRRTAHSGKFQGVLAFITRSRPGQKVLEGNTYVARMFRAASEYAEELGFKLEPMEASVFETNARLEKALHARGIRGIFLPPSDLPQGGPIELNWEHFSAVTFSTNLSSPPMDRVDTDHFGATSMAVDIAWQRGYRRAGFCLLSHSDVDSQGRWRGGYLASGLKKRGMMLAPPLVVDKTMFEPKFERWLLRHQPDVLIANGLSLDLAETYLGKHNISPATLGLLEINIHEIQNRRSGLFIAVEESSRRAVDHIVSRLYRNRLGLPEYPAIVLTSPTWHEGMTLPRRPASE